MIIRKKSCKVCRRLGMSVCGKEKCALRKKPYPPGKLESEKKHRSSRSEYGTQMIEKQRVRATYGVSERQFSNYVKEARAVGKGNPGDLLVQKLEQRLDNVVFRLGLTPSRRAARQLVSHGHVAVNGRKVTVPSFEVNPGDKISPREGSAKIGPYKDLKERMEKYPVPSWIKVDPDKREALIGSLPKEVDKVFDLSSVIEFYSR